MKLHELAPSPGSNRPKRRVGRGTGGKGGKTAGRGHQGPEGPQQHQARLRGRPAAPYPAHPEAARLRQPVPGGVQRRQPRRARGARARRGDAREPGDRGHRPPQGTREDPRSWRAAPGRERFGARLLPLGRGRHRGRGRNRDSRSAPLRGPPSPCQGKCPRQPLGFFGGGEISRSALRPSVQQDRKGSDARKLAEHVQGPRPPQQGPVHPPHHRRLPDGRQHRRARRQLQRDPDPHDC